MRLRLNKAIATESQQRSNLPRKHFWSFRGSMYQSKIGRRTEGLRGTAVDLIFGFLEHYQRLTKVYQRLTKLLSMTYRILSTTYVINWENG